MPNRVRNVSDTLLAYIHFNHRQWGTQSSQWSGWKDWWMDGYLLSLCSWQHSVSIFVSDIFLAMSGSLCSCLNLFHSSCNFNLFPISQSSRNHLCPLIAEKIERSLSIAEWVFLFFLTLPGITLCLLIFDWLFACVPDMHHKSRWTCRLEFSFRKTFWPCGRLCRSSEKCKGIASDSYAISQQQQQRNVFFLSFCAAWFNGNKTSNHVKTPNTWTLKHSKTRVKIFVITQNLNILCCRLSCPLLLKNDSNLHLNIRSDDTDASFAYRKCGKTQAWSILVQYRAEGAASCVFQQGMTRTDSTWNATCIPSSIHPVHTVALVPQEKNEDWQAYTEAFGNVKCNFSQWVTLAEGTLLRHCKQHLCLFRRQSQPHMTKRIYQKLEVVNIPTKKC